MTTFIIEKHTDEYPNEDMNYVKDCLCHASVVYEKFRPWYRRLFDCEYDKINFIIKHWYDKY